MNPIAAAAARFSARARANRDALFRETFCIEEEHRLLDLGSENGSHIHSVLQGTKVDPKNVYIADIDPEAVAEGSRRFGFTPITIGESGPLPFPDGFFDIVHCSSVIEHVTIPKDQVWGVYSGSEFKRSSAQRQQVFAGEIRRLGKQYFVQTPNKWFPLESHSWLPLLGWLPRRILIPVLRLTNRFWVKSTEPDWNLLDVATMQRLFADARIVEERAFGMPKSIIAVKAASGSRAEMRDGDAG